MYTGNRYVQHPRVIYILAAAVVATSAAGNSLLRVGMKSVGEIVSVNPAAYAKALLNGWFILGVLILAAWFILQLSLLSWADLTYVLPLTSLSYVLVTLIGALLLDENVSIAHWLGVGLIAFGVIIVGRTKPLTARTKRLL